MAASSTTSFLKEFSGKIGNQLVLKRYGNKSVICMIPQRSKRKKRTENQLKNNKLMALANFAAKAITLDPVRRDEAILKLNITRNRLYTTLVQLFFQQARQAKENGQKIPEGITLP